jgi:hypothetical protein
MACCASFDLQRNWNYLKLERVGAAIRGVGGAAAVLCCISPGQV